MNTWDNPTTVPPSPPGVPAIRAVWQRPIEDSDPAHLKVAKYLYQTIKRENLKRGDKVPSVSELRQTHLCSRGTVSKGYQVLADAGVIERKPGLGYFVSPLWLTT